MTRGLIFVEGHGETEAAINLVSRLWVDLQLDPTHQWARVYRRSNIDTPAGVAVACEIARAESFDKLLILRDEDDECPKESAPICSAWVRACALPVPVATVLLHREYETLFLASLSVLAGKGVPSPTGELLPGLRADTSFDFDFESVRGVKEWLSKHFEGGKIYKPTVHQLPFTRMLDFTVLRNSGLASFGSLERALRFLSENNDASVYP